MARMREVLAHGGIAILAAVFALAFAAFNLAVALAQQVVSAIQQHTFDEESGGSLEFTVFGTRVVYAEVLLYAITVALVAAGLLATWILTRRELRVCKECRSPVPAKASICRFCTSELEPGAVDA